jgi:hypothetical protein
MEPKEEQVPKGTVFTMILPLDRDDKTKIATYYLKDMDIDLYIAIQAYVEAKKYREAMVMMFSSLKVGGDDVQLISTNWIAFSAAQTQMMKLLEPIPGELKKN